MRLIITFLIIIFAIAVLIMSIVIHEVSHGYAAYMLGDPTAKYAGRLTLNPMRHLDFFGSFLVPMMTYLFGGFIFGWAKPVRFDPFNLKNPRRDTALISLAGPSSNLLLATVLAMVVRIASTPFSPISFFSNLLYPFIILNVILAIFNLIPIHPLDGGKILVGLLPVKDAREMDRFLNRYGTIILFLLIFPFFGGTSPVFLFLSPILNFILGILIPGSPII